MLSPLIYKYVNPFLSKNLKCVVKRRSESLQWQRRILLSRFSNVAIVDIGANVGQFVKEVRSYEFEGPVYSIEPEFSSFQKLKQLTRFDKRLHAFQRLILEKKGTNRIFVYSKSDLNSIFLPTSQDIFGVGEVVGEQIVKALTLDEFISEEVREEEIFVKIDTQGSELQVLNGLRKEIQKVKGIQVEFSLSPIYTNASSVKETFEWIFDNHFKPVSIVTERFSEALGLAFDVDLLAVREKKGD